MIPGEALVAGLMMTLLFVVMLVVPWLLAGAPASDVAPDREARLWAALVLVQATIWATLGPAQALAATLRARGLLGVTLTTLLAVGVAAALLLWSRRRPGLLEVVAAIGVVSAYLMLTVRVGLSPEERTHLFEYGVVAVLAYEALLERRRAGRTTPAPWPAALVLSALLGVVDELLQRLVPGRTFDPRDIVFNTIAVGMALTSIVVMRTARRLARARRISR